EVTGAVPGFAAVDFLGVAQRLAMVGDQVQVDRQGLLAAAQAAGQVPLQGAVDAALQLSRLGEGGEQGVVDGGVGGGALEGGAGGGQGGDPAGGVEEHGPQGAGGAFGAVALQAQVF